MKRFYLIPVILLVSLLVSCDKTTAEPQEPQDPTVKLNNPINDFVWRGMNTHYYWQEDVPVLADFKKEVLNNYHTFLNTYSTPEDLFESSLFEKGSTDRFSWFIEDYKAQDASFRGVNDAFGFEFSLARVSETSNDVIGYITYVVPETPASEAGLKRGDVFNVFNDVTLNLDNYSIVNKYYSDNSISMKFATINNGAIVSNGEEANLTIRQVIENPVHYSSVIEVDGKKVGYLVYNSFKYTFHKEMNDVFSTFLFTGIDDLVLDLRYNGGGAVLTSSYLASMIYSGASTDEVFAKYVHNSKNPSDNDEVTFNDTGFIYDIDGNFTGEHIELNRLTTLNRIYVITSDDTASASEMIINGLAPYMQVIKVGTTTYGKNVGSFTIYDSANFGSSGINTAHTNAMQPITFKIFNKLDQSDYTQGFEPDIEQIEYVSDMKPFGDINEPLLKRALDNIRATASKAQDLKGPELKTEQIFSSFDNRKFSKEMYILPQERN